MGSLGLARAALVAVGLLVCACRGGHEHVVSMSGMKFDPAELTVESGDRVRWKNDDLVAHTATSKGRFDSGSIAPQESFVATLSKPGAVDYACTLHPMMKGRIVVR
jgi:plastocyanin